MRKLPINLILTISIFSGVFSCTSDIETKTKPPKYKDIGVVAISFTNSDALSLGYIACFYKTPEASEPEHKVKIGSKNYTSGFDSILSGEPRSDWIWSLEYMPTPGRIFFRCLLQKGKWYQILTNDSTDVVYWLKRDTNTILINWLSYLQGGDYIDLGSSEIRTKPSDDAPEIKKDSICHMFNVDSMEGDWIRISTSQYSGHLNDKSKIKIKNAWAKWRNGKIINVSRGYNE